MRQHSTVPIAMGELFVNVQEYVPLIKDRLIDFIRVRKRRQLLPSHF